MKRWSAYAAFVVAFCSGGCSEEALPGHSFFVEAYSKTDLCNRPPVGYEDSFDIRLLQSGSQVDLFVGNSAFARGGISGCEVSYATAIWTDARSSGDLRWRMTGVATVDFGNEGCGLSAGLDWSGTEVYEIVGSNDPGITVGCTYELELFGVWTGEVQSPPSGS